MNKSPFLRGATSELLVSFDIFIAALPVILWSTIVYGARPIAVVLIAMLFGALFEVIYAIILRKGAKISTAALLGMTIAFFMPAGIDYVVIPIAVFVAVTCRRFIGGVINPIAAALLPFFIFTGMMTAHTAAFTKLEIGVVSYWDQMGELAVKTPLDVLMSGNIPEESAFDIFLGNAPGAIGAMSAILLLVGGIYLICRKVISWQIPAGFLVGSIVVWFFLFFDGAHYEYVFYHICAGGLFLGAFFGATEYSSLPVTSMGRMIHGVGCGALTMLFRKLGYAAESVLLSMLVMSLLSRVIDMVTAERYFGYSSKKIGDRLATFLPETGKKKK